MKNRSYQSELLDQEEIPEQDLFKNLNELNFINTYLGGHAVTLKGLAAFHLTPNKTYTILDIGCGGGDNLKQLARWGRKKGLKLQLTGVDLKLDCINYAKSHCKDFPEIQFIWSDYKDLLIQKKKYDIIFSALFCHHFKEVELHTLLMYKAQHAKLGFFINDLQRNWLAYHAIKVLTKLFSSSYLVKNDAPISVTRGFIRKDWDALLQPFGLKQIRWVWAFRWLIIVKKNDAKLGTL